MTEQRLRDCKEREWLGGWGAGGLAGWGAGRQPGRAGPTGPTGWPGWPGATQCKVTATLTWTVCCGKGRCCRPVAEVLALDAVRRGAPLVLAATDRLDSPVRWVHVIELARAAHLLRGGELVLSTGIALPGDPGGLARYVADLASVGVSALAVELGSRYSRSLPDALVAAAVTHRLPLLVFERETQFIEITESVHALIIDNQLAELRAAERMHQVFTELAVSGAPADEVVGQAATLAGCPVILENLAHQVLACATAAQDAAGLLAGFATRSRAVSTDDRTGYDPTSGWLVTVVGARGQDWGRLIMVRGGPPAPRDLALLERAATTLALGRLLDHQRESLERQAHRTILSVLVGHGYGDPAEAQARARALGVPVTGRRLMAAVVRVSDGAGANSLRPRTVPRPASSPAREQPGREQPWPAGRAARLSARPRP